MFEMKIIPVVKFNLKLIDPFLLLVYYVLEMTRDEKYNINSNNIPRIYFCGSYLYDTFMLDENVMK